MKRLAQQIILRSLSAPLRQIADNAGIDGSVVVDEVSQKPVTLWLRCQ
jgi:chaperonin GroEL